LHFRSIWKTHVPFNNILANTQAVYANYGIRIEMASGQSVKLTHEEMRKYMQLDGECTWRIEGSEMQELQMRLGTSFAPNEITVIYVETFQNFDIMGCGGHLPFRPACIVSSLGSGWDTAHEVGHVLLTSAFKPTHPTDPNNLMYSFPLPPSRTPILTEAQVKQMKASPCCHRLTRGST
jgi:hypothetical protein